MLIVFFPFCDARCKRHRGDPWKGFTREESEFNSLICEEKSRDFMLESRQATPLSLHLYTSILIYLFYL